jgi:hypothetical protein
MVLACALPYFRTKELIFNYLYVDCDDQIRIEYPNVLGKKQVVVYFARKMKTAMPIGKKPINSRICWLLL